MAARYTHVCLQFPLSKRDIKLEYDREKMVSILNRPSRNSDILSSTLVSTEVNFPTLDKPRLSSLAFLVYDMHVQ